MSKEELTPIGQINVTIFTTEFMQWVMSHFDLTTLVGRINYHNQFSQYTYDSWEEEYTSTFHLPTTKPAIEQAYINKGYGTRYVWIEMTDGSLHKLDSLDNVKAYNSEAAQGVTFAN